MKLSVFVFLLIPAILFAKGLTAKPKEKVYINWVKYFTNTEIYISVSTEQLSAAKLKALLDGCTPVLDEDENLSKTTIPASKFEKYFPFDLTIEMLVYTPDHKLVSSGKFSHFEFRETFEGEFVACYKLSKPLPALHANFYCTSANVQKLLHKNFLSSVECGSDIIRKFTRQTKVSEDSLDVFTASGIRLNNNDSLIFATGSFPVLVKDELAYKTIVLKIQAGKTTQVYQAIQEHEFTEILVLPYFIANRPVILLKYEIPNTDNNGAFTATLLGVKLIPGSPIIDLP